MNKCVIIANGDTPSKKQIDYLVRIGYKTIICADGGANRAYKADVCPDIIIGDFDSIEERVLNEFKKTSKIIYLKRQNDTDVEKCLKYAIQKKFTDCILTGAAGDRLDHLICNLSVTLKFSDYINIAVLYKSSVLFVCEGTRRFRSYKGETISLFGLEKKTKIETEGLLYPLKNESLQFGKRESLSNKSLGDIVSIKIKYGKAFIIRSLKSFKKYGVV